MDVFPLMSIQLSATGGRATAISPRKVVYIGKGMVKTLYVPKNETSGVTCTPGMWLSAYAQCHIEDFFGNQSNIGQQSSNRAVAC